MVSPRDVRLACRATIKVRVLTQIVAVYSPPIANKHRIGRGSIGRSIVR